MSSDFWSDVNRRRVVMTNKVQPYPRSMRSFLSVFQMRSKGQNILQWMPGWRSWYKMDVDMNGWMDTLTFFDDSSFHENDTQDDKQQCHFRIGGTSTHEVKHED